MRNASRSVLFIHRLHRVVSTAGSPALVRGAPALSFTARHVGRSRRWGEAQEPAAGKQEFLVTGNGSLDSEFGFHIGHAAKVGPQLADQNDQTDVFHEERKVGLLKVAVMNRCDSLAERASLIW